VRVSVSDTGHGLFGGAQTRAAEPFFSTKDGGHGLGLTSVATIVCTLQGLHIESDARARASTSTCPHSSPAVNAARRDSGHLLTLGRFT